MSRQAVDIVPRLQAVANGTSPIEEADIRRLCGDAVKEINELRNKIAQKLGLLSRFWQWIRNTINAIGEFMVAGLLWAATGSISYGLWEIYKPAGPIAFGSLIITGVILRARGNT